MKGSPAGRLEGFLCLTLAAVCLAPITVLAADDPGVAARGTRSSGSGQACATVIITAPEEGLTIATRVVTVEASFTAAQDTAVELVELAIDGVTVDAHKIDPPAAEGAASFAWLARDYADGKHRILVRAIGSDGQVAKAQISVVLRSNGAMRDSAVRILSPIEGERISGNATIQVEVDNPALAKYVIFLVDDVLRAISNVRPFTYLWDTTRYLNGIHILKAQAYSGGAWEAVSSPVQVHVDNPSGATAMREPKLTPPPMAPEAAAPARSSEATLPPPVRAESPAPAYPEAPMPSPTLAVPGTAPFVSPSGELITPPTPPPVEIAALPSFADWARAPSQPLAPAPASPSLAAVAGASAPAQQGEAPGVIAAESPLVAVAPAEPPAFASREPAQAPFEIAMLPPAERLAAGGPAPAAEAARPSEVAPEGPKPAEAAPAPAPAPAALAPAEHSAAIADLAPAPAAESQPVASPQPAASALQIAMLPPTAAEAVPAARITAEPAPARISYVVRTSTRLDLLARELGVPAREMARANGLGVQSAVVPGQRLAVPSAALYFDSKPLALDAPAVVVDGRAIVPFRAVIEEAGGQVRWDSKQHRASATARGHGLAVTIGSDQAQVDGSAVAMGAAARIRCSRTVVPLRFLGDALDLALQYQDGIIHIASAR